MSRAPGAGNPKREDGNGGSGPGIGRVRCAAARAMTLLEVTISIALVALLLGTLLTFFWRTITVRDQAAHSMARTQIAQQMLGRIAGELREAVALDKVGFPNMTQFAGDRRKISFLTAPLPASNSYAIFRESDAAPAGRDDLRQVTYELWIDPDKKTEAGDPLVGGILRTERQALDPVIPEEEAPQGEDLLYLRHDLWSYELGYLEFRYFDGVMWSTTWNVTEGNALPHLVQITIGYDSLTQDDLDNKDLEQWPIDQYPFGPDEETPSTRYTAMVRLPAADEMFSAHLHRLTDETQEVYTFETTPGAGTGGPAGGTGPGGTGGKP